MHEILPWILSVLTVISIYLAGNKSVWAWRIGFFAQFLWIYFAVSSNSYGLIPGSIVIGGVYLRNWIKWSKQ